ncbi:MAG TPA: ATP-binding protein [Acidimicrobiales bacterium]|jgi:two-component sensor histidine kinase|nr:ATP-binding protein [Acidimicrobiales bacterium]
MWRDELRRLAGAELDDDTLAAALLIGNELVTNAVRHGQSPVSVTVTLTPTALRVEVGGLQAMDLHPRAVIDSSESGRGLQIVAALSAGWGTTHSPVGGSVWFELARRPPKASSP